MLALFFLIVLILLAKYFNFMTKLYFGIIKALGIFVLVLFGFLLLCVII